LLRPHARAAGAPVARKREYPWIQNVAGEERTVSDSVYRVTEVIGASSDSWEAAARNAVETAGRTVRDLRVAEATRFDVTIKDGKVAEYRVRLDISFKYETQD
jgi:dodecin